MRFLIDAADHRYGPNSGEIYHGVPFHLWPAFQHFTNLALTQFDVSDLELNRPFESDWLAHSGVKDTNVPALSKYYWSSTSGGSIWQVGSWKAKPQTYVRTADVQVVLADVDPQSILNSIAADIATLDGGLATLLQTQTIMSRLEGHVRGLLRREFRRD